MFRNSGFSLCTRGYFLSFSFALSSRMHFVAAQSQQLSLHSHPSRPWSSLPVFVHVGTLAAGGDFHSVPDNPDETLVNEHFKLKLTCF